MSPTRTTRATRTHTLVDLYVPARLGPAEALQKRAAEVGLDAIVVVAEEAFELPNAEAMAAISPDGPRVLTATMVSGPGYRFIVFLPPGHEVNLESIEATGDARLVQAAVAELGGLALAVAPRQAQGGEVARATPQLAPEPKPVIVLAKAGSHLGRDLDLEDAAIAERPIYGASGPFAQLEDVGHYATLLPVDAKDGDLALFGQRIVQAIAKARGFAVELVPKRSQRPALPDPREGRNDEQDDGQRKRRRRRGKGKGPASEG
ncbi:MAG: hypothetical protein JNJ59_16975 [Deltaproteobacteria bacterium]|jgi:hypothetical protein|nr:hypothetical protein [Deltaproteobacteria bacterium]